MSQVFHFAHNLFFGAEGDGFFGEVQVYILTSDPPDPAIPQWGSADMSRSFEPQFAAHVVAPGSRWGVAGFGARPPVTSAAINPQEVGGAR